MSDPLAVVAALLAPAFAEAVGRSGESVDPVVRPSPSLVEHAAASVTTLASADIIYQNLPTSTLGAISESFGSNGSYAFGQSSINLPPD